MGKRTAVVIALTLIVAVSALAQGNIAIPLTYRGSTYNGLYNQTTKQLTCSADNPQGTWNSNVASNVPSIGDIAAAGTAYGPLFIYTQPQSGGPRVDFCMLQWQTGEALIPGSNTPLRGTIGKGKLLYANFDLGPYGAQVNVVAEVGDKRWLYRWDISQGGCKQIADPAIAPPVESPPPPPANTISGRITHWVGGSPTSWPTEQGLRGVKVIIGRGIYLDIVGAFEDYVRPTIDGPGEVVAEVETGADGSYSVEVPAANAPYTVILWKQWWVPILGDDVGGLPAIYNSSLQKNALEAGGKHSMLRYDPNIKHPAGGEVGDGGKTIQITGGKFSCQVPEGYTIAGAKDDLFMLSGPEKTGIVGIGVPEPVGAAELPDFATGVIDGLAPEIGISDLHIEANQAVQIAPGVPGLMRVAKGVLNGKPGHFAFLVFSTQTHSYTLLYAGQDAVYEKHFPSFESLLQTVRFR